MRPEFKLHRKVIMLWCTGRARSRGKVTHTVVRAAQATANTRLVHTWTYPEILLMSSPPTSALKRQEASSGLTGKRYK